MERGEKKRIGKFFPSMSNMLTDLKQNSHRSTRKHVYVAHLLQSLEATTVIGTICRQAVDRIPEGTTSWGNVMPACRGLRPPPAEARTGRY